MKKLLLIIVSALFLLFFLAPNYLLAINQYKSPEGNGGELSYFPESYDGSKARFSTYSSLFQDKWKDVKETSYRVDQKENLSIDLLQADAAKEKKKLVILSSATHGIEGYTGSAMQDVFVKEYLKKLDPETTGVLLIHGVNPWGMKHFRRYTKNNVDLNRNFIYDWNNFDRNTNKKYTELSAFMEKPSGISSIGIHDSAFYGELAVKAATKGTSVIKDALLNGQYTNPKGVYYGGNGDEPSTVIMKQLFEKVLKGPYQDIIHIDLHTGYGPRYQMSIFSSVSETMKEAEAKKAFRYPLVFTPDSKEFYVTNGDMTEYFYKRKTAIAPEKKLYSTTFEFGTLGDDTIGSIQSLKRTIEENQLFQHGTNSSASRTIIQNRYKEMFYPSEAEWRIKAVKDFRQALNGVMMNKGFFSSK
ncbi:M14 family metallopeptidase [Metabacillus sp. GX 13764]|uniref:M14 family metallopeptidase n=1 Tax=Metabacillus kandeliae TaxID=2900151 RepID=UPI001E402076|nr:M14 family metallopeptidase [Metabacillus kandeliae]MCD7035183.1 M14 family metallopeptidase [Metabacillus kandeliae]